MTGKPRAKRSRVYLIKKRGQMQALVSPARQEIIDLVAATGPLTVREMAKDLGRSPTSLYYHTAALRDAGLLVESEPRKLTYKEEAVYATPGRVMRIVPTDRNRDLYGRIVSSVLRIAERDMRRALEAGGHMSAKPRAIWGGRIKGWVTQKDLEEINAHVEAIIDLLRRPRPGPGSRLHVVTWAHSPVATDAGA